MAKEEKIRFDLCNEINVKTYQLFDLEAEQRFCQSQGWIFALNLVPKIERLRADIKELETQLEELDSNAVFRWLNVR